MQSVILSGGLGTRLSAASDGRPKHLVDVGGEPLASRQLRWLAASGVDAVVYSIGSGGPQIREHVGDGARFGLTVTYVDEGDDLRGTGGALRLALDHGVLEPWFLVLYGDSLLQVDIADVVEHFAATDCPALMTVFRNEGRFDTSNAAFDHGTVRYDKRHPSPEMQWIDYGLSILTRSAVAQIPPGVVYDLADLLTELSAAGELAGYAATRRFYEIGTPSGLAELRRAVETGEVVAP